MRAVIANGAGGPEVLAIGDVPKPIVGPGDLGIDVVAAGVNRADLLQRQGHYPPPPGISEVIGLEVSGHIAEVGEDVSGWSVGDPRVALLSGGGYAQFVAVPAGQVVRPPRGVDLVTSAGLLEVAATVQSNLDAVALRPGEFFLIHGGTGGIGSFAIQYAKSLGALVIATAGSAEKLEVCRALGADAALDYHEDWAAGVREATGSHGADVILDGIGAKYLEPNVDVLAMEGRLVVIGLQGGRRGTLDLNKLLVKRALVTATSLRGRPVAQKAEIAAAVAERVWPLITDGRIQPARETRFSLDEVVAAHTLLESGANVGKIVLVA